MQALIAALPFLLLGTGGYYLIRLRGFYLLHPVRCLSALGQGRRRGGVSPFRALTVALAGTLGVGNIVGVATALYLGGAGAVLWMLLSALVAMVLKYAEVVLGLRHRRAAVGADGRPTYAGGAPYYIEDGFSARGHIRAGRVLAAVFAALCLVNALTMGSLLQINAVAGAMEQAFAVPPLLVGGLVALLSVVAVLGGARRISALTERLVPLMTVGFLALCIAVLILRRERIPEALSAIWQDARHPREAGAGALGFLLSRGARYGVMRGLISNEAGCGTAPMAHAAAETDSPAAQGVFGLVEVFVDTVLLCTVTALAVLVSDSGPDAFGEDGVRTAQAAFSSVLGPWAGGFFALSILLFGVATVLCWAHYGRTCADYLARGRAGRLSDGLYLTALTVSLLLGTALSPALAWTVADAAIALMTLLNLGVLLLMQGEVAEETRKLFFHRKGKGGIQ